MLADFKDFEGEESDELDEEGVEEEIDSEEEALDEEEEGENDEEEEEDDDDEIESEDSESEEEEQVADQKVILKGKKVNYIIKCSTCTFRLFNLCCNRLSRMDLLPKKLNPWLRLTLTTGKRRILKRK